MKNFLSVFVGALCVVALFSAPLTAQTPDPMLGTGGPVDILIDGLNARVGSQLRDFNFDVGETFNVTSAALLSANSWCYLLLTLVPAGAVSVPGVPGLPGFYASPLGPPWGTIIIGQQSMGPFGIASWPITMPLGIDGTFDMVFQTAIIHSGQLVFGLHTGGLTLLGSPAGFVR